MPTELPPKTTPLYSEHLRLGARMVPFGGWLMPVQYAGIREEHLAVRTAVGLFDISHMGQLWVTGPASASWLNRVLTNNVERLVVGECQYTFLLNARGGVVDDLIVYRLAPAEFLLVVNASRIEEDFAWLAAHGEPGAELSNRSDEFAGVAVQGVRALNLLQSLLGGEAVPARNHIVTAALGDISCHVARTGYTGEEGFEIFCPAANAIPLWTLLLAHGASLGIQPCGLGARDTLRLEMCYPLNGSDLSPDHTPLEAGLGFFVDLEKPVFLGRTALVTQKERGVPRRLVPFRMGPQSPPPRAHYTLWKDGSEIGETTSGTASPSLGIGIGMAYLPTGIAKAGETIEVDIRGRRFPATVEKKPLYRPATPPPSGVAVP